MVQVLPAAVQGPVSQVQAATAPGEKALGLEALEPEAPELMEKAGLPEVGVLVQAWAEGVVPEPA